MKLLFNFVKKYITKSLAYKMKSISVYMGIGGYIVMVLSGLVLVGVIVKLIVELLRLPYYVHTDAPDMVFLALFFIVVSGIALFYTL